MLYFFNSFHDGGRYHIETSPMVCRENQWTGFYIITASVMKELNVHMLMKVSKYICYAVMIETKLFFLVL